MNMKKSAKTIIIVIYRKLYTGKEHVCINPCFCRSKIQKKTHREARVPYLYLLMWSDPKASSSLL